MFINFHNFIAFYLPETKAHSKTGMDKDLSKDIKNIHIYPLIC